MEDKKLKVCFFGRYDNKYSRNRILIKGLLENGAEVIECRTELKGIIKYFDLIKKHWKIRKDYDVLFVAFPGWHSVVLAKFLTRKPVIFDAFVSIYDSTVFDRKNTKERSLKAKYFWFIDWLSCKLADKVILDTNEHIKYFVSEFGLKREKFERIFVGTDGSVFYPREFKKDENKLVIHFHGTNIPLQGVEYILGSAKILESEEDIEFNMIGSSIKKEYGNQGYKNINFIENVPYEKLHEYISEADICLGIFGDTKKTQRVIPNKIYECIACKKPIVTADSLAIRELFNEEDLMLVSTANSKEIAQAVLELKKNLELRKKLAQNGYNKIIQNCIPKILGAKLIEIIDFK